MSDTAGMTDELPEGWAWAQLRELADIKGGVTKGQKRRGNEALRKVPYLRVANVQRGYLDLSEIKEIEATKAEIEELRLITGDVLLIEGGNREHLGRGWIWEDQLPLCIHQNHVFRARLVHPGLQPKYFSWYANQVGQTYFHAEASQTVNLASINLKALSRLSVAVPPPGEQQRIVAAIEALLARVEVARELLAKAASGLGFELRPKTNCSLIQAVLAKAFRGELVPTEAELAPAEGRDYEPAPVLLERIRAQREAAAPASTKRSGGRRKS